MVVVASEGMPVRFLSDAQREQLSGFPAELEPESLDRFFTLSDADLAEVPPSSRRREPPGLVVAAVRAADAGLLPGRCHDHAGQRQYGSWPASSGSTRACSTATGRVPRPAPTM